MRVASIAMLACAAAAAQAEDRPAAVPYRPSVSVPAQLSAPGWLELEIGGLQAVDRHPDADPRQRASLPYALKLAFTEDWGIRVTGEGLVRQVAADGTATAGGGETELVIKRRFGIDDQQALGLELGGNYPTARHGLALGSGKPDYSLTGIWSRDYGKRFHSDFNIAGTRRGGFGEGQGRVQWLSAWDLSYQVDERWTATTELSGTRQRGVASTAQILAALAFAPRKYLVFDGGFAHALNRATPTWQFFAGATVVLGRAY